MATDITLTDSTAEAISALEGGAEHFIVEPHPEPVELSGPDAPAVEGEPTG